MVNSEINDNKGNWHEEVMTFILNIILSSTQNKHSMNWQDQIKTVR